MLLVYVTRLCMGGIHTVWAAHTRSLSGKKFSSIISLEAALHHLPHGAACVGNNKVVCYQMTFYFFSFLVFFPLPKKLYIGHLYCWYFNLSSYSFNFKVLFLILYKSFICFQFHSLILIWHILFFSSWFLFFKFLIFFLIIL